MKVRYVEPGLSYSKIRDEVLSALDIRLLQGKIMLQEDVEEFEQRLAKYIGTKYAVGVNSGTDALYFAYKAAGIKEGDEVITVSHTFLATIETIVRCGAKPILVDIDENYLMDLNQVEPAITPRTKAIVPVHLSGDVVNMDKVMEIANKYNLIVIEDAAQSIGGEWNGKKAGSMGLAGCFSHYFAKILGTYGDAGAITTNDEEIYNKLKLYRNHWNIKQVGLYIKDIVPPVLDWAGNSRLDNLWAVVLNIKMKYLQQYLDRRKEIAQQYDEHLQGIGDIVLPTNREGRVYQDYIIRTQKRNELYLFLKENDIETLGADAIPNHLYRGLNLNHFKLPKTEKYTSEFLRLPCNPDITDEQVEYVVRNVKKFYGK